MYQSFFSLHEDPFSITPNPRFLFRSQSHQEALGYLLHGIEERQGFIAITGEVGTGKTLLCRTLLDHVGGNVRTALIFNSFLSELDLLRSINEDFGIAASGATRKELIDTLQGKLIREFSAGRNAVLIIDEAQNLAPPVLEQIRMLSNLETERGKLLQIVFVGQPEFRQQLARPDLRQLNQRIALRYHLRPLNRQETGDYIHHRLVVAGHAGGCSFPEAPLPSSFGFPEEFHAKSTYSAIVPCLQPMSTESSASIPSISARRGGRARAGRRTGVPSDVEFTMAKVPDCAGRCSGSRPDPGRWSLAGLVSISASRTPNAGLRYWLRNAMGRF